MYTRKRRRSLPTRSVTEETVSLQHGDRGRNRDCRDDRDGSSDTDQPQGSSAGQDGQSHIVIRPVLKYPYGAMFFVMICDRIHT